MNNKLIPTIKENFKKYYRAVREIVADGDDRVVGLLAFLCENVVGQLDGLYHFYDAIHQCWLANTSPGLVIAQNILPEKGKRTCSGQVLVLLPEQKVYEVEFQTAIVNKKSFCFFSPINLEIATSMDPYSIVRWFLERKVQEKFDPAEHIFQTILHQLNYFLSQSDAI